MACGFGDDDNWNKAVVSCILDQLGDGSSGIIESLEVELYHLPGVVGVVLPDESPVFGLCKEEMPPGYCDDSEAVGSQV